MPGDLRNCFKRGGVDIPNRALTVSDVESLWKQDRVRIVALGQCGNRTIAWYDQLRTKWR